MTDQIFCKKRLQAVFNLLILFTWLCKEAYCVVSMFKYIRKLIDKNELNNMCNAGILLEEEWVSLNCYKSPKFCDAQGKVSFHQINKTEQIRRYQLFPKMIFQ